MKHRQKIYIIEDDTALARQIAIALERYGYACTTASNYAALEQDVAGERPELILLDVNLPKFDGFYWCRKIREVTKAPILMMSARSSSPDQIRGVESGADDYLTKPFDLDVLIAKIGAMLRRAYGELNTGTAPGEIIARQGITLFYDRQMLEADDKKIDLSPTEASLLRALLKAFPNTVSRNALFMEAWDNMAYVEENTLNVNIRRIRNKMQENRLPVSIRVVRSFGYKLVIGGEAN